MRTFLSLDLAVIGCKVSHRSVEVVKQVFVNLRPSLNISTDIIVKNFSPTEVRSYLLEKRPRFCVLVMDAVTVQEAYKELATRREEYELLLRTAANNVGKTVVFHFHTLCRTRCQYLGIMRDAGYVTLDHTGNCDLITSSMMTLTLKPYLQHFRVIYILSSRQNTICQ